MDRWDQVTMNQMAAALAVAALCLVVPRLAHAELSHEALWGGAAPASCAGGGAPQPRLESYVGAHARSTPDSTSPSRAPATGKSKATLAVECLEAAPEQSEASNNLCFEKAGVPASVVPALAAKAEALERTDALVDRAREMIGLEHEPTIDRRIASRTHPIGVAPPSQPNRDNSCTKRPESCRSLPPIPPTLSVDATATAPPLRDAFPTIPEADRPQDAEIPNGLRVSHAEGYRSPPLKPPRGA